MTRNRPGLPSLHHDLAHQIIKHLNTKNVAKLRTAGKSVKNFGKNGATCQAQENHHTKRLRITGTAVSTQGQSIPFIANVYPQTHGSVMDVVSCDLVIDVRHGVRHEQWGRGRVFTDETLYDWVGANRRPEQFVLDQVIGCVSRELQARAPYVASIYRDMRDAMIMETGPSTAAQVRTGASRVRQRRGQAFV